MSLINKIFGKPNATSAPTTGSHKDLRELVKRLDFGHIKADVRVIMDARTEAEQSFFPHRVKMQKVFDNTVLNDQVFTCMERRKDLTLLRKYELYNPATNEPDKEWTDYLQADCFKLHNNYALDGLFYGYNLIALGDIINDKFPHLGIVNRRNVSPDRHKVASIEYGVLGDDFLSDELAPWHIWCTTPTENGRSPVGYGLLFRIALLEIIARGNRARNATYNEVFGAPLRVGKTTKQDEDERQAFFDMLVNMGGIGAVLLDEGEDEIEFKEVNTGTGYETYANLEDRIHKGISKITLGHGDAVDSTPGKLGAEQGEDNPIAVALRAKQVKDGTYLESIWNDQTLPKLREIGIKIPAQLKFRFLNDEEKEETRKREDANNKTTAEVYKIIKDAGGKPDWKEFSERTGITVEEAPPPPAPVPPGMPQEQEDSKQLTARMRATLNKIYKHQH